MNDFEAQPDGADFDLVARREPLFGGELAVDAHAVGAAEIAQIVAVPAALDSRVPVADAAFGQLESTTGVTSDHGVQFARDEGRTRRVSSLE